jgi:hypothetical protein
LKFTFSLFCLIALISACGKTEGIWDELEQGDKDAITARAYDECKAETASDFADFQARSAAVYISTAWERGDAWKHELKNGATVDTTHNIRVWKNAGNELYLLIERVIGSNTRVYFLRIPKAINQEMIEDLNEQYCRKQIAMSTGPSQSSATENYIVASGTNTKEYKETSSFDHDELAYMGGIWRRKQVIVTKDNDGDVTNTTTLTSTFSSVSTSGMPALNADYTTYAGATFCDITEPTEVVATGISFVLPYVVSETCSATPPVGAAPIGWTIAP